MTETDGTWTAESDWSRLDGDTDESTGDEGDPPQPVLAVVGRPNVGKSTLVNRILGRREAVVQDTPGVTRDRVAYDALWNGRKFTVVDTGGWEPDAERAAGAPSPRRPSSRWPTADAVAARGRRHGRRHRHRRGGGQGAAPLRSGPVMLAANKVDDERLTRRRRLAVVARAGRAVPGQRAARPRLRRPARRDPRGAARDPARRPSAPSGGPRRVALVGKPNVGKSSLLNQLTGEERAVVDSVAGTTVDPVDSLVELDGELWRFVDTAGLRKRVNTASGTEYYASLRTKAAIEAAEVAIVLLDASEPISEQDLRVLTMVVEAGRAWCWRSTSGTWSTRTAATSSRRSWSAAWCGCRGPSGSTSPRSPAARCASWPRRCAPR